jgi:heme/copper-type cytochrome/quinol oxidase subunit 4
MGYRKGKGGGESSGGGGANITTIILGAITIVLALIGLGIAMDTIAPYLTGGTSALNWTRYPGGESMLKLFPLIMLVGLVIFGGVLVWMGSTKGKAITIRDTVFTVIVVVVAVIMLPIVMDAADTAYDNTNAASFTGLTSFLGLVPLIYTVGLMFISGLLGRRVLQGAA